MPAFTRFYGIKPWEIDLMTYTEIIEFREQMRAAHKEAQKK